MRRINPKDPKHPTRTELAADNILTAQAELSNHGGALAGYYEKKAAELLIPLPGSTEVSMGEAVPLPVVFTERDDYDYSLDITHDHIIDTLEHPDTVSVDASMQRTTILHKAGALEIGIDMSATIKAGNSMEKALAHQLAVCHVKSLELMTRASDFPPGREDQQVKLFNVACRLMDTYQKGMDTLTRTRNAGKGQQITVKQIRVEGGQNIIADNVSTGGGGGAKSGAQ